MDFFEVVAGLGLKSLGETPALLLLGSQILKILKARTKNHHAYSRSLEEKPMRLQSLVTLRPIPADST